MYVAGRKHPHREPALQLLQRVRNGEFEGVTSTEVLQEILYRYCALNRPDLAFAVYDSMVEICVSILPVTLADTDRARQLIEQHSLTGVRDAIHAAVMLGNDMQVISSFDSGFDVIPGVRRMDLQSGD